MPDITFQISSSSDDAVERGSNGNMDLVGSAWRPGSVADGATDLYGGLRFRLDADQGSDITAAKIRFVFPNASQDNPGFDIQAQLVADALTFSTSNSDISNRSLTVASVNWTLSNAAASSFDEVLTVDFSSVLQEVVDQPSFVKNNWVAIVCTGTSGRPNIATFDRDPAIAPILEVSYIPATPSSDVFSRGLSPIESGILASGGGSYSGLHSLESGYI